MWSKIGKVQLRTGEIMEILMVKAPDGNYEIDRSGKNKVRRTGPRRKTRCLVETGVRGERTKANQT